MLMTRTEGLKGAMPVTVRTGAAEAVQRLVDGGVFWMYGHNEIRDDVETPVITVLAIGPHL
jgi:hypothetical protein